MDIGIRGDEDIRQLAESVKRVQIMGHLCSVVPTDVTLISQPGSELETIISEIPDPLVDPRFTLSYGLTSSYGCLHQICDLFNPQHATFPVVLQTLLRTALLGSSRIVYMLGPEDHDERLRNTTVVLAQEGASLIRAYDAFAKFEVLHHLVPPPHIISEQKARYAGIGIKRAPGEASTLKEMAEVVARRLELSGSEFDDSLSEHVAWLFNTLSGVAHGFGWPNLVPGTESMSGHYISDFSRTTAIGVIAADLILRRGGIESPGPKADSSRRG